MAESIKLDSGESSDWHATGFMLSPPAGKDFLPLDAFASDVLEKLKPYSLMLACLHANAFPSLVDQYAPEAYAELYANGWIGQLGLPDLYG